MENLEGFVEQIESNLAELKVNLAKFKAGNNSAGARVRLQALNIRNLTNDIRKEVSAVKKQ